MATRHHYLGFKHFPGRGLRYVATWDNHWLALAGWQVAALKLDDRDRWIGWSAEQRSERLHLVASNGCFLVLTEPRMLPNLASYFLSAMTRCLSDDWLSAYGHGLLLAESFCDPEQYPGAMYKAVNWEETGTSKGFARSNGRYTSRRGKPKRILMCQLRRDAKQLLVRDGAIPSDIMPAAGADRVARDLKTLRALYRDLVTLPENRRAQGKRHSLATVLAIHILADRANMKGCTAAAEFARTLSQEELAAIGARKSRQTGRCEPVSKSTLHRVTQSQDPKALQGTVNRFAGRLQVGGERSATQARKQHKEKVRSAALGRLFSAGVLAELADRERSPMFARLVRESGLDVDPHSSEPISTVFDEAFAQLKHQAHRNEYVYKAAITEKVLFGTHTLKSAAMMTEFRTGHCKADLVILNGTGNAYEIKSERDSLNRLANQIAAYSRVFATVNVFVGDKHFQYVNRILPEHVGILTLSSRYQISRRRQAYDDPKRTDTAAIFQAINQKEAARILKNVGATVPDVPNGRRYMVLKALFLELEPKTAHREMVTCLKDTRSLCSWEDTLMAVPCSLRAAMIATPQTKHERGVVVRALATPISEALVWG